MQRSCVVTAVCCFSLLLSGAAYGDKCKPVRITDLHQIKSATVEMRVLNGKSLKVDHTLQRADFALPADMEECPGVPKYFVLRLDKVYLVEKAKFRCFEFDVAGKDQAQRIGGAPGSGNSNTDCRKSS